MGLDLRAARTFRCYGIGEVWGVGFCWVRPECFTSRMIEKYYGLGEANVALGEANVVLSS